MMKASAEDAAREVAENDSCHTRWLPGFTVKAAEAAIKGATAKLAVLRLSPKVVASLHQLLGSGSDACEAGFCRREAVPSAITNSDKRCV